MPRNLLALLAALALSSCVTLHQEAGVSISSDPPGALIFVNGHDTGFVTPAMLDLGHDRARIDLVKEGYQTATRRVSADAKWDMTYWKEMEVGPDETWRFPMWVDYPDFLGLFRRHRVYVPGRIFVRLRLAGGA